MQTKIGIRGHRINNRSMDKTGNTKHLNSYTDDLPQQLEDYLINIKQIKQELHEMKISYAEKFLPFVDSKKLRNYFSTNFPDRRRKKKISLLKNKPENKKSWQKLRFLERPKFSEVCLPSDLLQLQNNGKQTGEKKFNKRNTG